MPYAGQRVLALDFTAAVQADDATTQSNIASSTPATGSPTVDLTFTAPTSGKALVSVGGRMRDDSGSGHIIFDYRIYLGTSTSGTLVFDTGSNFRRCEVQGGANTISSNTTKTSLITGLTAGATYYAIMYHYRAATSDTADIFARQITVTPLPA